MDLKFKAFKSENGCNSFVVADGLTKQACLIDPKIDDFDLVGDYISANDFRVELAVDTHTHADHYSATHLAAERWGAQIAMSELTKSERQTIRLKDGDVLKYSDALAIRALATPGHTPDSMSFLIEGSWGAVVFTGDTLLIGASGRTDFPGACARTLYSSLQSKLGALAPQTWVLPGHDYSGLLFSTIEHELQTNPHLTYDNVGEFVQMKDAEALDSPCMLDSIVKFNLNAKPLNRPRASAFMGCASSCADTLAVPTRRSVAELAAHLSEHNADTLFVDVREPDEFAKNRLPKMMNIPLGQLFLHWDSLKSAKNLVFFCQRGNRSLVASRTVSRLGLKNAEDVEGGILAWIAAGHSTQRS